MNKADKILAAGLLILACIAAAPLIYRIIRHGSADTRVTAVISVQGNLRRTINLSANTGIHTFRETGKLGETIVEVSNRRIRIASAPCPDKLCVKHGWARLPGEAIACVPGEVVIHLEGDTAVDAVTR